MFFLESVTYHRITNAIKTTVGAGIEYDNNTRCDVCLGTESYPLDEIVFCDGCEVGVHQSCYGIANIPSGEWHCDVCSANLVPNETDCCLCAGSGGAMKMDKKKTKWCHLTCAMWMPEVQVSMDENQNIAYVDNIENVPAERWNMTCQICKIKGRGMACVQFLEIRKKLNLFF